jgi:hypothetical protein
MVLEKVVASQFTSLSPSLQVAKAPAGARMAVSADTDIEAASVTAGMAARRILPQFRRWFGGVAIVELFIE